MGPHRILRRQRAQIQALRTPIKRFPLAFFIVPIILMAPVGPVAAGILEAIGGQERHQERGSEGQKAHPWPGSVGFSHLS